MPTLRDIPEVAWLDAPRGLVRIPPELDVPLTPRIRRLVDTPEFRRLANVSQLGLVSLVYPAATHSRFEHSLGVYRLALMFLRQLSNDARFTQAIGVPDAELFLVSALLHDVGHWPYCHPIEDLQLPNIPSHEGFTRSFLLDGAVADALRQDWGIEAADVVSLLGTPQTSTARRVLASLLSGPIDVDKMDYLARDSLHAGVPYGRNFDQARLLASLCLNERGDSLAITDKGKTAAEMMVFARYVMFSEVYWHHSVRSATAMLQRAFYLVRDRLNLATAFRLTDGPFQEALIQAGAGTPAETLLAGLFGAERRLFKRVAQYSLFEERELYEALTHRPYGWLVECSHRLATILSTQLGDVVGAHEILLDAPPVEREIEFNVDIYFPKSDRYRSLAEVSPVVRTLAKEQFDDFVKRVRLFAHPRIAMKLRDRKDLGKLVEQAVNHDR